MRVLLTGDASTQVAHRRSNSTSRLIAAAPATALAERWRAELAVLRRRSPTSDAATTLADCLRELVEAINSGDDVTLRLTLADAHAISRIPLSTLRWLCKHKSVVVGARKHDGVWYLDRARFEEYLESPSASSTLVALRSTKNVESALPRDVEKTADLATRTG